MKATLLASLIFAAPAAAGGTSYAVLLPNLALAHDESIQEIHLVVACGHIDSVSEIPMDGNVNVARMISGKEEPHAEAGHGASGLSALVKFNGAIRVIPQESECFNVEAKLLVSGSRIREVKLARRKTSPRLRRQQRTRSASP